MFLLEFELVHRGCIANELSRAVPNVRMIAVGGFVLENRGDDEIIALDNPTETDIESAMDFLRSSDIIEQLSVIERSPDRAFIHLTSNAGPEVGYCSETVERNRCHKIGLEIQHEGVERWRVRCTDRSYAEGHRRGPQGDGGSQISQDLRGGELGRADCQQWTRVRLRSCVPALVTKEGCRR